MGAQTRVRDESRNFLATNSVVRPAAGMAAENLIAEFFFIVRQSGSRDGLSEIFAEQGQGDAVTRQGICAAISW